MSAQTISTTRTGAPPSRRRCALIFEDPSKPFPFFTRTPLCNSLILRVSASFLAFPFQKFRATAIFRLGLHASACQSHPTTQLLAMPNFALLPTARCYAHVPTKYLYSRFSRQIFIEIFELF
jgi:hypothetical protein